MRRLKVWTGTHPNELAAMRVGDSLSEDSISSIETDTANPLAKRLGKRWVHKNLMFAYPGNPNSHIYEERRAAKVLQQSVGYYAVIDLHNNDDFGENTAAIDIDRGVSPVVLGFLGDLGIRNLIATKHFGLHAHVINALALETLTSDLGSDTQTLRDAFDNLSNSPNPSTANAGDFNWFTYVSYGLHVDAISPDDLSEQEFASIRAFQPVPDMFAQRLGVQDEQICPMGWSAQPNEYGYWAELVTPAPTPDDTHWQAA